MTGRWVLAGVWLALVATRGSAAENVRVPPGRDPGGVAIAIVGPGIDYRPERIWSRLARDGEGEIIGFDLTDNDRRPFADSGGAADVAVMGLLEPDVPSRLVLFRANASDRVSMAKAISLVSKSPARIVFLPGGFPEAPLPDFDFLAAASKQFPELLFVVPVGDQAVCFNADGAGAMPNVVVVTVTGTGTGTSRFNVGGAMVDVAAEAGDGASPAAAAAVAALAARLSAANAGLSGAALKAAVVALAKAGAGGTRFGTIASAGADLKTK